MPLTGSGQISFNDVRIEMSQSAMTNYAMSGWTWGLGDTYIGSSTPLIYAPINILSSGSRWSPTKKLILSNLSMSAWYNYDHNLFINTGVTFSLYQHADYTYQCNPSTMLPVELGTTNTTYSINVSGSAEANEALLVYYGKPWNNDGSPATPGSNFQVVHNFGQLVTTGSFTYNYTYNANSGSKIYFVLLGACP